MPFCFRWNHPGAEFLGVLAVDVDSFDAIVHVDAVIELELALQVDLNECLKRGSSQF